MNKEVIKMYKEYQLRQQRKKLSLRELIKKYINIRNQRNDIFSNSKNTNR